MEGSEILSAYRWDNDLLMCREGRNYKCPECGAEGRCLADEHPDACACGYDPYKDNEENEDDS